MRLSDDGMAGIGLRSAHYRALLDERPKVGWLEVHPENYFCGGLHKHYLERARELYPVSFHGVGLSLGSAGPVSSGHLAQLKALVDRFEPVRVSDHAAWSASGNAHLNDLLPLPYNEETLAALCRNIETTQDCLGRTILIENPSTYLAFQNSCMSEPEFLIEAARRTGCGLLLDISNIFVQAHNHGIDPHAYIEAIPLGLVGEFHLAGHSERQFSEASLLIDTHNRPVADAVWPLYEFALRRLGAAPALIEWDQDLPPLRVLADEAQKADGFIRRNAPDAAA